MIIRTLSPQRSLVFLPLGDALTIIFTTPLFTVILSFVFFRIRIGLWKAGLCAVLFAGMILNIQPPFIFPTDTPEEFNLTASYHQLQPEVNASEVILMQL